MGKEEQGAISTASSPPAIAESCNDDTKNISKAKVCSPPWDTPDKPGTEQFLVRNLEEKQETRQKHEQSHMQPAAASRQGYAEIIRVVRDKISLRSEKEQAGPV